MLKTPANSGAGEGRRRRRKKQGEDHRTRIPDVGCSSPTVNRLLAILRKCRGRKRLPPPSEERDCRRTIRKSAANSGKDVRRDWPGKMAIRKSAANSGKDVRRDLPEKMSGDRRENDVSECQKQEMTFNLALGFGLFSLIAASKTQLDKAIELRKEMEAILRSIQEEHQSNGGCSKLSDAQVDANNTLDGLSNVSPYSTDDHAPSFSQVESGISFVCDKDGEIHEKERFLEGMKRLEEELAVELDLLQLHMETENSSESRKAAEMSYTDTSSQSVSDNSGEVIDDVIQYYGVPPLVLERRLHELLQTRQEERIKELEAHLECLKQRLNEKEADATWGRKLESDQVSESSRFFR